MGAGSGALDPAAPEPVAPEPVAPEPVAPEPVAPEPVAGASEVSLIATISKTASANARADIYVGRSFPASAVIRRAQALFFAADAEACQIDVSLNFVSAVSASSLVLAPTSSR